jgi:hypothetical protein
MMFLCGFSTGALCAVLFMVLVANSVERSKKQFDEKHKQTIDLLTRANELRERAVKVMESTE